MGHIPRAADITGAASFHAIAYAILFLPPPTLGVLDDTPPETGVVIDERNRLCNTHR